MLQLENISLSFGERVLLNFVNLLLGEGEKAGLVGVNGSGKSTLLRIITGEEAQDSGRIIKGNKDKIVYLPQEGLHYTGSTLKEEVLKAFDYGKEWQDEITRIGEEITLLSTTGEEKRINLLLERQNSLIEKLNKSGYIEREKRVALVLKGLGFTQKDYDKLCSSFSGGYQMRVALAKVLLGEGSIFLLDEPTNYLDKEAVLWLSSYIKDSDKSFLIVSHNALLLKETVSTIYELTEGALKRYRGGYDTYLELKEQNKLTTSNLQKKEERELKKLDSFIDRFRYKASKARQAQERIKMRERLLENKTSNIKEEKSIHFSFPPPAHSPVIMAKVSSLYKTYDGKIFVIEGLNLQVTKGDHLLIAGGNGSGKSTFLRLLAGVDKEYKGEIRLGEGVKIGYFNQDSIKTIAGPVTIYDYFTKFMKTEQLPLARNLLGSMLFIGDDIYKTLDLLSGGERARLALLLLLLRQNNLLLLDELTNHLDAASKDVVTKALLSYQGTLIFTSHDKDFSRALANKVLVLTKESEEKFSANYLAGGYDYYQEKMKEEEILNTFLLQKKEDPIKSSNKESAIVSYQEKKLKEARERKLKKEVSMLEDKITELESKKKKQEELLAKEEVYKDRERSRTVQKEIESIEKELERLNKEWEVAEERVIQG